MIINKTTKKYKLFYIIFLMLSVLSFSAFSQPVINHDLMVELKPEKNQIHVIDKIDISSLYLDDGPATNSVAFLIHAGESLKVVENNVRLKKQDYSFAKKNFPNLIGESLMVGTVPVDVYSLQVKDGKKQLTLEYMRVINHAIESGGKEYERSISESSGLITEQGVFIAKESFWFPVFGNELLTFNLSVRTPLTWKSVSQGDRIYTEDNNVSHMDTWRESRAQDDIYIVAAKFTEYSQAVGAVKAMAFLRTADDALAQKYLNTTAQYLEMYRGLLGPYPYSKFALVENFWETGFGMPSFTLLGPKIIRFPFILHSSYPHELLHNWWGNSVYVDYEKGNWAEGLTSYLADHLIKEQRGKGKDYRRASLQKYTNFANSENDFALQKFVSRYDAVTEAVGYGKTLMLFHMLRQKVGNELFSTALQSFYRQYRHKTASFNDIENVFSEVSDQNLKAFFSQWVENVGAPNFNLKDVQLEKLTSGKFKIKAQIEQTQAGDAYQLNLPIVVSLADEKKATQIAFNVSNKTELFEMEFDSRPLRLDVDPEFDVFRRLDINETPPSLSLVFGAKKSLIVLPANASEDKLAAYESLAKNWQSTQQGEISIEFDKNLKSLPKDKSIWLLGWENIFRGEIQKALDIYQVKFEKNKVDISEQDLFENKNSIIMVGRNPQQQESALALISADSVKAIPGLARKLPHYGKYSFLAFEGVEPTNMLKGQWPVVNSPLTYQFSDQQVSIAKLEKRNPLASLAPVFSEKKLLSHVNKLANKEMLGRGLGSKGLDLAADYIAEEFRSSGLKPLVNGDKYFQDWKVKLEGLDKEVRARNVVAFIPGNNPKLNGQSVVVSAHYDHLGLGWPDVRKGNEGKIHFGADDNASGVSVLLELARLMAKKGGLERTVIFVAFTGEEVDRLGSRYFVNNMPRFPIEKVFAAVNLDTVGRLGTKPILAFGTGTASEWVHIFRGVGFVTGVSIKSLAKDFGSSDQTSFHEKNIPAVQFFSGVNSDFHKPTDTIEKIDGAGLVKVAVALKETVSYLSEREEPLNNLLIANVSKQKPGKARPAGRRVSLGTVPDFTYQGEGVLISDVVPNSPAAKAKIQAKDILIGMNGKKVKDLRSFSKILRSLKPGDEVVLKILRNTQELNLKTHVVER